MNAMLTLTLSDCVREYQLAEWLSVSVTSEVSSVSEIKYRNGESEIFTHVTVNK